MKRKNYNLMIGGAITLFFLAVALIGQFWTPYGTTTMDSMAVNLAPCAAHPLGTDNFGRDILSRVMAGSAPTIVPNTHPIRTVQTATKKVLPLPAITRLKISRPKLSVPSGCAAPFLWQSARF